MQLQGIERLCFHLIKQYIILSECKLGNLKLLVDTMQFQTMALRVAFINKVEINHSLALDIILKWHLINSNKLGPQASLWLLYRGVGAPFLSRGHFYLLPLEG